MAKKSVVRSEQAPAPFAGAPYSQAVRIGDLVFVSGQIPLRPGSTELVVKTTVYLKELADFAAMNEVYKKHAGAEPPARSTVQVVALPAGALVEIEAVAHL